jgi:hypothetical protein
MSGASEPETGLFEESRQSTRQPEANGAFNGRRGGSGVLSKQLATILTASGRSNSFETVARLGFSSQPFLILMDGLAEHNKM